MANGEPGAPMAQQPAPRQQVGSPASPAWPARLAQLTLVVSACVWAAARVLGSSGPRVAGAAGVTGEDVLAWLVFAGFVGVGTLIVTRRPGNRVGWLMVAGGALWAVGLAALDVAYRGIVTAPGSVPAASVWALGGASMRGVGWYLLTIGVPMVFPDGRLAGPRWRWLPWLLVVVVTGSVVDTLTAPGANLSQLGAWRNPIALPAALWPVNALAFWASVPLGLVVLGAVVVQLVGRWRRGSRLVRQQLTLFAVAAALPILAIPVVFAGGPGWLFSAAALPLPFAIGFAVLARGLYDIGRLLTRTLVYGLLTAVLGGTYAGVVLGLGQLLGSRRSSLAVAGATLAVAAAFQPARRRIQQVVDRRFNRHRYDAAKTIQAFSTRLRDQIDLDTLSTELLAVVDQTMEPTRVSLWFRPSAPGSSGTARSEPRPTTWTY
jgi:hypothetical protein